MFNEAGSGEHEGCCHLILCHGGPPVLDCSAATEAEPLLCSSSVRGLAPPRGRASARRAATRVGGRSGNWKWSHVAAATGRSCWRERAERTRTWNLDEQNKIFLLKDKNGVQQVQTT